MLVDRTSLGVPGVTGYTGYAPSAVPSTGVPVGANYMMVPKCTYKVEKCAGGLKITCCCEDKVACSMLQSLCSMMAGGLCSCCCMMNGQVVCQCNFAFGICKCEMTSEGCCFTCTSGDPKCCEMLQACCDCICCCLDCGCTCCVMLNNTPVCCGVCETTKKVKSKV